MKKLVDTMMITAQKQGASEKGADTIVIGSVAVVIIVVLTIAFIIVYDTLSAIVIPPWAITIVTALGVLLTGIVVSSHATSAAVTVQTSTVKEQQGISKPVVEAAAQATIINAQTMQAVLAAMAAINQIHASSTADTATALDKATVVTQAATERAVGATTETSTALANNTVATDVNTKEMQKGQFHDSN